MFITTTYVTLVYVTCKYCNQDLRTSKEVPYSVYSVPPVMP